MGDNLDIRGVALKVSDCVKTVASFAASINPIFGVVSSVVGAAQKSLEMKNGHNPALDKGLKEINTMLKEFSKKNKELLKQIRVTEVSEILKKYEEYIKCQYRGFTEMIEKVRKDQANAKKYMYEYGELYERVHSQEALQVYYNNVAKNDQLFGRPVLEVYMEACNRNHEKMEKYCLHLAHIFQKGLTSALMAFTAATEDDVEQIWDKWKPRLMEIQEKFDDVLKKCQNESS